ncbi:MFS transporter [Rugosimonospora africana]|uniref:Putative sugar efflux transporter n=1 Tax=Rugosimonospora africana TaxID=556532 RepID=A0A8J3QW53_9ACTN|nr:MFS transporter [Rugosimonospora africana]GIH15846.1 putative sugar efflux transporter [Rugosimonospora africana]
MNRPTDRSIGAPQSSGWHPPTSPARANAALLALSVAAFCFVTTEILPIGLLTVIAGDLHRSRSQVGLLVTGYAAVVVLAALPLTGLTRRLPRRWLLGGTLAVFAAGALTSALARDYPVLLATRMVVALSQAVFWSVVNSSAAGLFPPNLRGRTVARVGIGNALAPVLGVPAGTWLGQQAGWRWSFAVMGGIGVVVSLAVLALMPTIPPDQAGSARGASPDPRRYAVLLAGIVLCVTGYLTAITYITPFLLDVTGFGASSLSPLLFASGLAGLAGTVIVGTVLDRHPRPALVTPLALIVAGLLGLYATGTMKLPAIVLLCVTGLAYSALVVAVGGRTLQVAPGNTDVAGAGVNSAFNVGIGAGALLGSALIGTLGTRSITLVGGLLTGAAFAVLAAEPLLAGPRLAGRRPAGRGSPAVAGREATTVDGAGGADGPGPGRPAPPRARVSRSRTGRR